MCNDLLAMEPASDFILLEELVANREADTWTAAMQRAMADLPVTIVVAGADECRALKRHIAAGLGAEHGPDLFHMQRELWQAIEPALATSLQEPAKRLAAAEVVTASWRQRHRVFLLGKREPGRHSSHAIADAVASEDAARAVLQQATDRQAAAHHAIRSLSDVYHPVVAPSAGRQPWTTCGSQARPWIWPVSPWPESEPGRSAGQDRRCPSAFRSTGRNAEGARRRPGGALSFLPAATRADLDELAREADALFTRSTSCVEGRNGRLPLLHHGVHRLALAADLRERIGAPRSTEEQAKADRVDSLLAEPLAAEPLAAEADVPWRGGEASRLAAYQNLVQWLRQLLPD